MFVDNAIAQIPGVLKDYRLIGPSPLDGLQIRYAQV
jgi:hypothetical protein